MDVKYRWMWLGGEDGYMARFVCVGIHTFPYRVCTFLAVNLLPKVSKSGEPLLCSSQANRKQLPVYPANI